MLYSRINSFYGRDGRSTGFWLKFDSYLRVGLLKFGPGILVLPFRFVKLMRSRCSQMGMANLRLVLSNSLISLTLSSPFAFI